MLKLPLCFLLAQCLHWARLTQAHLSMTYPGWRGNNLITNETFPFGMQWIYPCGGLPVTTNRTYWPIDGGAIAFQPGWNGGHKTAVMHINIGLGEKPDNYSWSITTFDLEGPSDNPYPGTVCLPQVTLPEKVRSRVKSGDLATIQLIETAKHGAGLFTCADIIFTDDMNQVPDVNESNCFISTGIRVSDGSSQPDGTQYPAENNGAHLMQGNNGALVVASLVSTFMFLLGGV